MKRSILIILLFCLLVPLAEAQLWRMRRFEAIAGIGPTLFFPDIGGYSRTENNLGLRDMSFSQTSLGLNLNLKYRITQDFNARISLTYGSLHANDVRGSNEGRRLEASTSIFEPAIIGEFYFIKNRAEDSYLFTKGRGEGLEGFFSSLDFYVFTGLGGLIYSVNENEALLNRDLDPGGFTGVIPVGVGSSLVYTPNLNFGIEIGGRYLFSDYVDGYTSKYSSANDVYYLVSFSITYKLKTGPNGLPSFR